MYRHVLVTAALVGSFAGSLAAQTPIPVSPIRPAGGVALRSFTPVDSFFVNPTQSDFTVTLNNTISGSATEYRVSRFADFRDATWRPYDARPALTIPGVWFEGATPSTRQVLLHFQVRNRNPNAGRPVSLIDGKTEVQPEFFFSDVLIRRVRLVYAG
jgi:hypothetical protein